MPAPTMTVPASRVKIRMYRQGLGDCFLLAFPTRGRRPCYMLIDCGVLLGTEDAEERMRKVAESLREATGGRIDVLVVTHQHWDHLSGFEQAREVFDELEIGEVWAAWTEDPDDPLARELSARRAAALRALHAAARSLRLHGALERAGSLESLLGFFGERDGGGPPATERALRYVLGRAGSPRFCVPGEEPHELPGVETARVYVLGPPRNQALLARSGPSRQASEVYEKSLALDEESAFHAAALGMAEETLSHDDAELKNLSFPFDRMYRVPMDAAKEDPFFREHYFDPGHDWRRIDADWLDYACDLALRLDSDTNNTSLALAIELVPSGKVLLFPADAQVGNWLSWHGYAWRDDGEPDGELTVADLLRRTVVYKVGHHCSHNATLREQGLELMESPELVALLPVDEATARKPKGGCPEGWNMPFPPLLARLVQKTHGRVVRADTGLPAKPPYVSARDWKAFEECCDASGDGLYIELTVNNPLKRSS